MKNLSQFKEKVNARELLVQALYEFSFGHNNAKAIEDSFRKDFRKTKIDYIFFKSSWFEASLRTRGKSAWRGPWAQRRTGKSTKSQ